MTLNTPYKKLIKQINKTLNTPYKKIIKKTK